MHRLLHLMAMVALISAASCGGAGSDTPVAVAVDSLDSLVPESHTSVRCGRFDSTVHRMTTHVPPGRLNDIFTDTNDLQLTAATHRGIRPIESLAGAYHVEKPLVHITTCDAYIVDSMRYSLPYLVPRAARLLHDMGQAFADTVYARSGGRYRMKVTSALRTTHGVQRLMRRNRSATEQSCHRFATTFDVSWVKFDCRDSSRVINEEDLKNVLAEIVYDMRQQKRCYAIYERRQGCFHITVR